MEAIMSLCIAKSCDNYLKAFVVKALESPAQDKLPRVRGCVAYSLGEIGDTNGTRTLVHLLKDENKEVRTSAARALGRLNYRGSTVALIAALDAEADDNGFCQLAIVEALGKLEDTRAVPSLVSHLDSTRWDVRRRSAGALGQIRNKRAVPSLIEPLDDPNNDVQCSAARSLGDICDIRALQPLITVLREQEIPEAAIALGKLNDPKAIRPLVEIFEKQKRSPALEAAAEALGNIRHPDVVFQLATVAVKQPAGHSSYAARLVVGKITGVTYRYDAHGFARWWRGHQNEFITPEPAQEQ